MKNKLLIMNEMKEQLGKQEFGLGKHFGTLVRKRLGNNKSSLNDFCSLNGQLL